MQCHRCREVTEHPVDYVLFEDRPLCGLCQFRAHERHQQGQVHAPDGWKKHALRPVDAVRLRAWQDALMYHWESAPDCFEKGQALLPRDFDVLDMRDAFLHIAWLHGTLDQLLNLTVPALEQERESWKDRALQLEMRLQEK